MSDSRRRAGELNHVTPVELGGDSQQRHARRPPALRVIPDSWEPRPGVPKSRAACKGIPRPCPYVRCRYHLWLKLSEDRDGRPHAGRKAPSILWPTSSSSCALDVASTVPKGERLSYTQLGAILGVSDERARVIAKRALAKLVRRSRELLGYELPEHALGA